MRILSSHISGRSHHVFNKRMIGDSIDHIIQMQGIWHRASIKFEPIVVSAMTRNSIDQII